MQNLVDQLELDLDLEREFTGKVCSEKKTLEIEVKTLKEVIANKEEHEQTQPNKSDNSGDKEFRIENCKLREVLENQADVIKALDMKNKVLNRNLEEQKNDKQKMNITIKEMEAIFKTEVSRTSEEISEMKNKTRALEVNIKNQKDEHISELVSRMDNKTNADSFCSSIEDELVLAKEKLETEDDEQRRMLISIV